jgi:hypothetical protein
VLTSVYLVHLASAKDQPVIDGVIIPPNYRAFTVAGQRFKSIQDMTPHENTLLICDDVKQKTKKKLNRSVFFFSLASDQVCTSD